MGFPSRANLHDWLSWIEGLHHSEIELGLERVREVAQRMNLLDPQAKVITVAGTNGKGSCVATLQALFLKEGRTFGAYTSPHLLRYNERIVINGESASDQAICEAFVAIDAARENTSLTYFEFGTLAALYLFSQQPLDFWLLEVGMGGRLDAVNIVDSDLAVITAIGLDHQSYLGETREQIAVEKAGVIRRGKPVICADEKPPHSLCKQIDANQGPAYFIKHDFSLELGDVSTQVALTLYEQERLDALPRPQLPLPSVAAACLAFDLFLPGKLTRTLLEQTFAELHLNGRGQRVSLYLDSEADLKRDILLDVAHNPDALRALAKGIKSREGKRSFDVLIAMMDDKDIRTCLAELIPVVDNWYLGSLGQNDRAATEERIHAELKKLNVDDSKVSPMGEVDDALNNLLMKKNAARPLLITGSFYTVARALETINRIKTLQ